MQVRRMTIPIDPAELAALVEIAHIECRPPREQARYIIREALIHHGLLPSEQLGPVAVQPKEARHVTAS